MSGAAPGTIAHAGELLARASDVLVTALEIAVDITLCDADPARVADYAHELLERIRRAQLHVHEARGDLDKVPPAAG